MESSSAAEGSLPDRAGEKNVVRQVLVLIDLDFILEEYEAAWAFYNDLYPGGEGSSHGVAFPITISTSRLLQALSHFCDFDNARPELYVFASDKTYTKKVLENDLGVAVEVVRGIKTYAMLNTVVEQETCDSVILVADAPGYDLLLQALLASKVDLFLIRHRQEGDHDASHMPTDIRYQYADYIAGLTLGVSMDEL